MDRISSKSNLKRGRVEAKPVGKQFYIGTDEWVLTPKNNFQILFEYASFVMENGYGAFKLYEHSAPTVYIAPVLIHMFHSILIYNHILTSSVWQYVDVEDAYPDKMVYNHENNLFYIATSSIAAFLKSPECNPKLTFVFECDFVTPMNYGEVPTLSQTTLARLFVIADHCATHYLETLEFNKTDLYCHAGYGRGNYTTLGSRLDIKTATPLTPQPKKQYPYKVSTTYQPLRKNFFSAIDDNNYLLMRGVDPLLEASITL